jgi:hypothetical protein
MKVKKLLILSIYGILRIKVVCSGIKDVDL